MIHEQKEGFEKLLNKLANAVKDGSGFENQINSLQKSSFDAIHGAFQC